MASLAPAATSVRAAENQAARSGPKVMPASEEGVNAMKGFQLPTGYKVELAAAEPLFANPVSFTIDEQGRFYVAETFRFSAGVLDIRGIMHWLDEELASKSVAERIAYTRRHAGQKGEKPLNWFTDNEDRISIVWDSNGDGVAETSSVLSTFSEEADGIGSGVLTRKGKVWYTNIPHLWQLEDKNGDGKADVKKSLSYGYGVRFGFLGHDSHGLRIGPDGRLYYSIGDRGAHIELPNGKVVENLEEGAIYRCEQDGSNLEIFYRGLRNPQELVFDDLGNLWTCDNNSDAGDPARVVYAAQDGDSGWRIGWQFIERPMRRGSWLGERLCYEYFKDRAAYTVPPVSSKVGNGPSGLTYDPGIALTEEWRGRFFLANFSGNPNSGIYSFAVEPLGSGFALKDNKKFWWNFLPTDIEFGYDGAIYATDWVNGWSGLGKGRIYRLSHPDERSKPAAAEVKQIFAEGFDKRSTTELVKLIAHADQRVRQEAQFALVDKKAEKELSNVAASGPTLHSRLHAIWGLGQLARQGRSVDLNALLKDKETEVRAQTLKIIADAKLSKYQKQVLAGLADNQVRVRYFAALAAGKLGDKSSVPDLLAVIKDNDDKDPWLRNACVVGLTGCAKAADLAKLSNDASAAVRLAATVALRRLESPELSRFLADKDPRVVAEAARAINDIPVVAALPALASLTARVSEFSSLPSGSNTEPTPRDAILRRVINANFRLGTTTNADAVSALADDERVPENIRVEALTQLGEWSAPSGRDQVSGLWRPLQKRAAPDATHLEPMAVKLITSQSSATTKIALLETAQKLNWKTLSDAAFTLVSDEKADKKLRVAALQYMGASKSPKLTDAVHVASQDKAEELRTAATKLAASVGGGTGAVATLANVLKSGGTREKQAAFTTVATVAGKDAATLLNQWLDELIAGKVAKELQLDLIEAASKRPETDVKERLAKFDKARQDDGGLGAYAECFSGGDKDAGRKIFVEKLEVSCIRCHRVQGAEGGDAGPNLGDIGKRQDRRYILESVIFPNKVVAAGFENVTVSLKDGRNFVGVVKEDTKETLGLLVNEDGEMKVMKFKQADIASRAKGLSGMPDTIKDMLTKREIRDLVEYLVNQK
ncbi:MAG TPA: HEAT repeat domain-containing protein [Verrucomicrobiae bacterium]